MSLGELLAGGPESAGRVAAESRSASIGTAPCLVDLVGQGPHALVAGTTRSGKSELLVTWITALARCYPASEVTFLLVDFKGGAAFTPLRAMAHVLGTLTDLDARIAGRAVSSLSAELRRRERVLAEHGVRSIEELPAGVLARLVVVVDEFAPWWPPTPNCTPCSPTSPRGGARWVCTSSCAASARPGSCEMRCSRT